MGKEGNWCNSRGRRERVDAGDISFRPLRSTDWGYSGLIALLLHWRGEEQAIEWVVGGMLGEGWEGDRGRKGDHIVGQMGYPGK